jgi:hypothetical protein
MNPFPANRPESTNRAVSILFQNLRRYSQLKVHQCLDTLASKVNILMNFFLSSSLECVSSLILFQLFSACVVGTGVAH